jgi:hypothetical protein
MPRVSELTELPPDSKPKRGLDYDEIADGRIWELVQGEDFKGKPEGVESRLRAKARELGRSVETRVQQQGRSKPPMILVQFSAANGSRNGNEPPGSGDKPDQ